MMAANEYEYEYGWIAATTKNTAIIHECARICACL